MAKICPRCNVSYTNDAVKCVTCNGPLEAVAVPKKKKAVIVSLIVSAVALLLALITVAIVAALTGPRGRVHYIMRQLKENDIDAVVDTLPDFLSDGSLAYEEELMMHLTRYTEKMSDYVFSFNTNRALKPSTNQMTELMESIRLFVGDSLDETQIEDVKMVWVDFRGGLRGFWNSVDLRFVMIYYKGEWCWWPYY